MANYVSEAEINTYTWTTIATTLNDMLNGFATAYINNYLKVTDLNAQTTYTETKDYNWTNEYMLNELNPSNLTLVNWSAVVWNIDITWRKLTFKLIPINTDTDFNKITFTYDYGFSTIPDAIKQVALQIVWYFYNKRSTGDIASFSQWQISITYKDTEKIEEFLKLWLEKYKKNNIYC